MPDRILVISHAPFDNPYGASTSIREQYQAFEQLDKYEFIHVSKASPKEGILKGFQIYYPKKSCIKPTNVSNIFSACLPWSDNYDTAAMHHSAIDVRFICKQLILDTNWRLRKKKAINTFLMFYPKIIHLNSLVLAEVIPTLRINYNRPIISHVRELLKHKISEKNRQAILQLDAVITIDSAVTKRFIEVVPEYPVEKIHQILNPFSARPFDDSLSSLFPDGGKFVFAIIGTVSRDKGVDLVCECFYKADLEDSVLIVFGSTDSEYASSIKMKWLNRTSKIIWVGEHEYLAKRGAYSRIDVVVRADPSFRTGRTVYEGLYAESDIVIQGDINDLITDSSLLKWRDNITMYKPRDRISLVNALRIVHKKLKFSRSVSPERKLSSNYDDYRERMDMVYSQLLKSFDFINC
ncbi:hypothetical protein [Cylindrospermopsis raciborskii]|uniref:hypothetical protein n=1 Tax=Cylindrospermopsis raciborskii TaxID=77022 RepID=UPI0008DC84DD|nr:hypothetical protein [Cylindrospermopsis raciborskii]NLQ06200.1 glycosyltransferase family 4 protein [Cylindrospermopsis raciborskii MVCC19]OHY34141.1 hypothetical protein BCV64_06850 [Cylindrospermopsis raciborskii MVCC14]